MGNTPLSSPGSENSEAAQEQITVEQMKNPFFWLEYNARNADRVQSKGGPGERVRTVGMMVLFQPKSMVIRLNTPFFAMG